MRSTLLEALILGPVFSAVRRRNTNPLGISRGAAHYDSASRLVEHFSRAGPPVPNLFREIVVGGGTNSPLYGWLADTMRSVWPQLVETGVAAGERPAQACA